MFILSFFLRLYLFIFRGEGREKEREGQKHQCVAASHVPLLGTWLETQACALDWESNQRTFGSQAGTQSTEP